MSNRIGFKINLKNEKSTEIHSHRMNYASAIEITTIPYLSKRNSFQTLATASIKRETLLLEHHVITGTKKLPIHIKSDHACYILIACMQGNITYRLKKDSPLRIELTKMECVFIYAQRGVYLATPTSYPTEILTICLLPEMLPLFTSNNPNLFEFLVQQKSDLLSILQVVQINKSFLNKLRMLFQWDQQNIDVNGHLLKRIPLVLTAYVNLIVVKSKRHIYQRIVETSMTHIQEALQSNQIPAISWLAKKNHIKPQTLDLAFKEVYRTTVHKKVKALMLIRIAELLLSTDFKLLEIALTFSYADTNTLNRIFKRTFGKTMGHYRKTARHRHFSD